MKTDTPQDLGTASVASDSRDQSNETRVVFRKFKGEILALMPYEAATVGNPYHCTSYAHIGQHSAADPLLVVQNSRLAKPSEYQDLAAELQRIGYRLNIGKRISRNAVDVRRKQLSATSD